LHRIERDQWRHREFKVGGRSAESGGVWGWGVSLPTRGGEHPRGLEEAFLWSRNGIFLWKKWILRC